jgi:arsenical-resistance protein
LLLNWVLGPALMFTLAWVLLPDLPAYRTGLIIVGLARCIAMVIIWNDLAGGDREAAAVLVALNSVFQVLAFAGLALFYLVVLPRWLGLNTAALDVSSWAIARSVLVFLGIPLLAGYLSRRLGEQAKGRDWYETRFLPRVGPVALYGLLFTIVICSPCKAGRSSATRWTSPASRCPCSPTSRSCGAAPSPWASRRPELRALDDAGVHRRR